MVRMRATPASIASWDRVRRERAWVKATLRRMGAWGEGVLENDAALDWIGDLEDQPQVETVTIALSVAAAGDDYLDADDGSAAMVAAEIVAAALGRPVADPDGRISALARRWPELTDHAALAAQAVERVGDAERSELADLWAEAENDEWPRRVTDLRARIVG